MAGKLSQPGCHSNTGTSSRGGRSVVKLDVLPKSDCHRGRLNGKTLSSGRMRGSIRKPEKQNGKNGKKLLGRKRSLIEFGSKPVKAAFSTAKEGVEAALSKFKVLWAAKTSPNCLQVLAEFKERYPHLVVNNRDYTPGHVPGVDIGKCFASRAELCLVGLHRRPQAGIDWIDVVADDGNSRVIIALSIVITCGPGGYEDDVDEGETLTYTGEGGKNLSTGHQAENQKFERGNIALWSSFYLRKPVRVIRGRNDANSSNGMIYSYDGLYKVVSAEAVSGRSGFEVYRYRLVRERGQPPLRWHSPVPSARHKISRGWLPLKHE